MDKRLASLRFCVALGIVSIATVLFGEQGKLSVHVIDLVGHPVASVSISTSGDGGGPETTDDTGRATVRLAINTKPNTLIGLQIVKSPKGHDLVMISPWNGNTLVPSFENESNNFVEIVVAERHDLALLTNEKALQAIAARINLANAPRTPDQRASAESGRTNLEKVAKDYGLQPDAVDKAIRSWGERASDPYDVGLASLYQRNYPAATDQLRVSLQLREKNLKADQDAVASAAYFLGQSLYAQGLYGQANVALDRALELRPNDSNLLGWKALTLLGLNDETHAEPIIHQILSIYDAIPPTVISSDVADNLSTLGSFLSIIGDLPSAERVDRRALALSEKVYGSTSPDTADALSSLGDILKKKGDLAGAEPLYRRALAVNEKVRGSNSPDTADSVTDLADLLDQKGDLAGAESLYRRALAINEKVRGPDSPDIADSATDLADLLDEKNDYIDAEPLYRRALAINKKARGLDSTDAVRSMADLADVLEEKDELAEAESLCRDALNIEEKVAADSSDQPHSVLVERILQVLGIVLLDKKDVAGSEAISRRILAIDEKRDPESDGTKTTLLTLTQLLIAEKKYGDAEELCRRALAISEKTSGSDSPGTKVIRDLLLTIQSKVN